MEISKANAICMQCGSAHQNSENALCVNGCDDWVEEGDDFNRLNECCKKFKIKTIGQLKKCISEGIDLKQTQNN